MRCVGYVRVSTKEQDEEIQRKAIEDFARSRGVEVVKFYVDKGESGAKPFKERPSAQQLMSEIGTLKPECVVAWSIDRVGRSMLDTASTILEIEKLGVKVISVKEEWLQTLDENIRKLVLMILAWVAEQERRRIRERQEEAWRQGKQKGRPPKLSSTELESWLRRYPTLSLRAITDLINAERRRRGQPEVSYYTVLEKAKRLGYRKLIVKEARP